MLIFDNDEYIFWNKAKIVLPFGDNPRVAEVTFYVFASKQDGSTGSPTSEDFRILDSGSNATGMFGGAKIYYEIHGEGFPCILIMGLAADVNWWTQDVIDAYSQNFKTIIFDNRGAGRTDKPEMDYSVKMFADDTIGLMDVLNIKKAHISGASMGGMIAQIIAINYPERVEKLILCCTHCGGSKAVPPSDEVLQMMMKPDKELTPEEMLNQIIPLCFTENFIKSNPDFIESYKQQMLKTPMPIDSYERQLKAVMNFRTGVKLKKISAPTLIVHGKEDILVPPENAEILLNRIPNAKRIMIDDAAHLLFQPDPEKLIKAVTEFLLEKI